MISYNNSLIITTIYFIFGLIRCSINDREFSRANVKVDLGLASYATKLDLKNATRVHTFDFPKKNNLANLDIDK